MRARWILLGLILAATGVAVGFRLLRPITVDVAKIVAGPAVEVIYATGFVEVEEPVEVAPRVTAPITEILVREGDRVVRGQVLASLDASDQRALITQLAAQTRWADIEAARTLRLVEKGFATKAARDRVITNNAGARAAEAVARNRLEHYTLRASINGVVLRRDAEAGDLASPTKTLFVIGDPVHIKVTATVDERDIPRVIVGQQALMSSDAYPGRVFKARVREITLGGDPNQRAFRVRLEPDRKLRLPVGLTFEVNIVTREKAGALLAPDMAVEGGKLWRVEDGTARRVGVKTGIAGAEAIEITEGVSAGDMVIINPPAMLKDGTRVRARAK